LFDPEAARVVLRAPWKKIVCTPTDISVKTRLAPAMIQQIDKAGTPLARYVAAFTSPLGRRYYVGRARCGRLDRSVDHHETRDAVHECGSRPGAGYGNTLTWSEKNKPAVMVQPVEIQSDLDKEQFYRMFVSLISATTPAH